MRFRPCFVFPVLIFSLFMFQLFADDETNPLCTVEYCIPAASIEEYVAQMGEMTTQLETLLKEAKSKKKRVEAYLQMAQLFEHHIGFHELTFELYEDAIEIAQENKKGGGVTDRANSGLQKLAAKKFKVLETQLTSSSLVRVTNSEMVIVPRTKMSPESVQETIDGIKSSSEERLALFDQALPIAIQRLREIAARKAEEEAARAAGGIVTGFHLRVQFNPNPTLDDQLVKTGSEEAAIATQRLWKLAEQKKARDWIAAQREHLKLPRIRGFHGKHIDTCGGAYAPDKKVPRACRWGAAYLYGLVVKPTGYQLHWNEVPLEAKDTVQAMERLVVKSRVRVTEWWLEKNEGSCDYYSLSERLGILDRFITKYPEYQERGKLLVDDIMFAHAVQENRLVLFQEYIATFADPKHRDEALVHIERKYWEVAHQKDTLEAYAAFQERYPDTRHRAELDTAIERLEFVRAKHSGSVEQLLAHLQKYPNGSFTDDAEGEIDRLRFIDIRNKNTIVAYQQFMKQYPDSRFYQKCEQGIEAIRAGESFNVARKKNASAAFESFLSEYPDSAYAPEAKAMVAFFKVKKSKSLEDAGEFFHLYHQVQIKRVVQSEYAAILRIVADHATAQAKSRRADTAVRGVTPDILLHQELWSRDHYHSKLSEYQAMFGELELLSEIFVFAQDTTEQLYALQRFDSEKLTRIFSPQIVDKDGKNFEGWKGFWGNVKWESIDMDIAYSFTSDEYLLGAYQLEVKSEVDFAYVRQWNGVVGLGMAMVGKDTERFTETFSATASVTIGSNQTVSPVWFDFPRIQKKECKEGFSIIIGSCKQGTPIADRMKVTSITLAP